MAGLAVGLVPAWQTSKPDLAPTLKEQSGSVVSGGSVRLRKAIVVIQVALSLLLLIGAGLFVRSLSNLLAQDPGFQPANLVAFNLEPSLERLRLGQDQASGLTLIERLDGDARHRRGRGVGHRGFSDGGSWNSTLSLDGHAAKPGEPVVSCNHIVMPGLFHRDADPAAARPRLHRARCLLGLGDGAG